jgi:hypothetical protein
MLAPPPRLVTAEERQRHCQLVITKGDEHTMAAWRESFPPDIINEWEFYTQKSARPRSKRRRP